MEVQIRKMQEKDIEDIYLFIHKAYVEKYYPQEVPQQWEAHRRWYQFVLQSSAYVFYIIEQQAEFVGTIRYELEEERAYVSIFLKEEMRGKRIGRQALEKSLEALLQEEDLEEIYAEILEENEVSKRLFLSFGFTEEKKELYSYQVTREGKKNG